MSTGRLTGGVLASSATATVAGPTTGVEAIDTTPIQFISDPVSADVTISGTITFNIWAAESSMNANVAINVQVDKIAADGTITSIVKSARTTEVAITTRAVNNFTATPGAGVTVNKGERIRVRVFGDDAGTMGSGFTFNFSCHAASAGIDGDTYVTFTETISFVVNPTGTTLRLTDVASDVSTSSVDREAWTDYGLGVQTDIVNTASGWTNPIQLTDTAGGTVVDWFTRRLNAFTLSGHASFDCNAVASAAATAAGLCVEVARVDEDGTNAVVWATWMQKMETNSGVFTEGAVNSVKQNISVMLSGDDLAISDGQRLRIRIYIDDSSNAPMVTGRTVTVYYAGTSASGDDIANIRLDQTVTEYVVPAYAFDYVGGGYYP